MMSNPYSPSPADAKLARGSVVIESAEVKAASMLTIAGCLPTPCHQLRLQIPESPDTQEVLRAEAWSVFDPSQIYAQMLQPFSVQIEIPITSEKLNQTTTESDTEALNS